MTRVAPHAAATSSFSGDDATAVTVAPRCARTRTCPSPSAGDGTSSMRTTSTSPYAGQTAARTSAALPHGRPLLHERGGPFLGVVAPEHDRPPVGEALGGACRIGGVQPHQLL